MFVAALLAAWTACAALPEESHFAPLHSVWEMNLLDCGVQSERAIWLRETLNGISGIKRATHTRDTLSFAGLAIKRRCRKVLTVTSRRCCSAKFKIAQVSYSSCTYLAIEVCRPKIHDGSPYQVQGRTLLRASVSVNLSDRLVTAISQTL